MTDLDTLTPEEDYWLKAYEAHVAHMQVEAADRVWNAEESRATSERYCKLCGYYRDWHGEPILPMDCTNPDSRERASALYAKRSSPANTKHTPGPWTKMPTRSPDGKLTGHILHRGEHGASFALLQNTSGLGVPLSDEEAEANAILIAAAPDLLAALVELTELARLDGYGGQFDPGEAPAVDRAISAMAKAKGAA